MFDMFALGLILVIMALCVLAGLLEQELFWDRYEVVYDNDGKWVHDRYYGLWYRCPESEGSVRD